MPLLFIFWSQRQNGYVISMITDPFTTCKALSSKASNISRKKLIKTPKICLYNYYLQAQPEKICIKAYENGPLTPHERSRSMVNTPTTHTRTLEHMEVPGHTIWRHTWSINLNSPRWLPMRTYGTSHMFQCPGCVCVGVWPGPRPHAHTFIFLAAPNFIDILGILLARNCVWRSVT